MTCNSNARVGGVHRAARWRRSTRKRSSPVVEPDARWRGRFPAHPCVGRRIIMSLAPFVSHQTIIVLDFGSQYTQLIARRLRELSVYSEIWPPDTPAAVIQARHPAGIILSGGPKSVSDPGAPRCDPALFEMGSPVLGICYGMQLMAHT